MSISDVITSIGTLVTIAAVIVGTLLYIITKQAGKPNAKVLIIVNHLILWAESVQLDGRFSLSFFSFIILLKPS